jgi:hypothetical protein
MRFDISNRTPVNPPVVIKLQAKFYFLGNPIISLNGVGLSVQVVCPALQRNAAVMPASRQIVDAQPGLGLFHDVSIGNTGFTIPLYFSNMPPNCNILSHKLIDVAGNVIAVTPILYFSTVNSAYTNLRFSLNTPGIFNVKVRPSYTPEDHLLDTSFTVILCGA